MITAFTDAVSPVFLHKTTLYVYIQLKKLICAVFLQSNGEWFSYVLIKMQGYALYSPVWILFLPGSILFLYVKLCRSCYLRNPSCNGIIILMLS